MNFIEESNVLINIEIPSYSNLHRVLYKYFHIDKYSIHLLYHGQLLRGTFCTLTYNMQMMLVQSCHIWMAKLYTLNFIQYVKEIVKRCP